MILSLTLLLLVGLLSLWAARRCTPAARHSMALLTLLAILVLPFVRWLVPAVPGAAISVDSASLLSRAATAAMATSGKEILLWLWLPGAVAILLRFAAGTAYLARQTRHARPWRIPGFARYDIRLAAVATPLVWGWRRPTILLPLEAAAWNSGQLRMVLLHEQAHIERRDLFTALLVLAAQAAYWFHPLLWWLSSQLRREQEYACDARVLAATDVSRLDYADALLSVVRLHQQRRTRALAGCAMISRSPLLKGRLMQILRTQNQTLAGRWTNRIPLLALALLLALLTLPTISAQSSPPYKIGGDVLPPKLIDKVEPSYTDQARNAGVEGKVLLKLVVSESGKAESIQIVRSLDAGLDQQAVIAIEQWRFAPGTKQGVPVAVQANVEVDFKLK